jgi:hypothetical protein
LNDAEGVIRRRKRRRRRIVMNVNTVKAIGLTMPAPLLLRADHVIE